MQQYILTEKLHWFKQQQKILCEKKELKNNKLQKSVIYFAKAFLFANGHKINVNYCLAKVNNDVKQRLNE